LFWPYLHILALSKYGYENKLECFFKVLTDLY